MEITNRGRFRETKTGVPVDKLELEDSEYDEVRIRMVNDSTAHLLARKDGEIVASREFNVLKERYLGLEPTSGTHHDLEDDLQDCLLSAGYTAVTKELTTPVDSKDNGDTETLE